jgi:hypothetical protein
MQALEDAGTPIPKPQLFLLILRTIAYDRHGLHPAIGDDPTISHFGAVRRRSDDQYFTLARMVADRLGIVAKMSGGCMSLAIGGMRVAARANVTKVGEMRNGSF